LLLALANCFRNSARLNYGSADLVGKIGNQQSEII
jgi:hypothetical protein